jgi:hypothetical protein
MLRAAALAGLGVALLPEDSRVEDVLRGALVHVLSQLSTRSPSRALRRVTDDRGWFPAKGHSNNRINQLPSMELEFGGQTEISAWRGRIQAHGPLLCLRSKPASRRTTWVLVV